MAVPLLAAAASLAVLAAAMQLHAPAPAFCALLAAVLVWAPDAVMASWPATFLQVRHADTFGHRMLCQGGGYGGTGMLAWPPSLHHFAAMQS